MRGHEGVSGLSACRRGVERADGEIRFGRLERAFERGRPHPPEVCAPFLEKRRGRVERHVPHRGVAVDQAGEKIRGPLRRILLRKGREGCGANARERVGMKGRRHLYVQSALPVQELERFRGTEPQLE